MLPLSKQEIKLMRSPSWRLKNLYWISGYRQTENGFIKSKVKFAPNPIQSILDENSQRFDMVLKSRQVGISTYYLLKRLDKACFNEHVNVAIVAHELKSLRILFSIIRYAYNNMNPAIRPEIDRGGGSMYQLYFPDNNSKIYCTLEAVSDAVTDLHISEMALMESADRVQTSIDSVALDTGTISIETTARGFNQFHDFWTDPNSIYKKHFFPWYLDPRCFIKADRLKRTADEVELSLKAKKLFNVDITDGQIAFRRAKISAKKSKASFLQEYPEDDVTCFLTSGNPAMDLTNVQELIHRAKPAIEVDGAIQIFENQKSGHKYVCGVDTAEGVSSDYSVATIFDADLMEQVAILRGHFKPYDFAGLVDNLCRRYTYAGIPPLLAVERNNHGHAVLLELDKHLNYPNLYIHKDDKIGWLTDRITRPLMIDAFIDGVENRNVTINDRNTLQECLTLVDNNGKIEATEGKHDDCIVACSIAIQMALKFKALDVYDNIERKILL